MPITLDHQPGSSKLSLSASGKLESADYERFVPKVESLIQQHGKLDLVLELHDFHGWTAGALWEDLKFDFAHFNEIRKLAIVGEKKWQKGMAAFCKPFTTAKVRFFTKEERAAAHAWIEGAEEA